MLEIVFLVYLTVTITLSDFRATGLFRQLRSRRYRSLVALAGPLGAGLFLLGLLIGIQTIHPERSLYQIFQALIRLEAIAVVVGLLPLPGLDGYGILEPWLPIRRQLSLRRFKPAGPVIVVVYALASVTYGDGPATVVFPDNLRWFVVQLGLLLLLGWGFTRMRSRQSKSSASSDDASTATA